MRCFRLPIVLTCLAGAKKYDAEAYRQRCAEREAARVQGT